MSAELTVLSATTIDAATFQVDTAAIKADVEMWGKMTIAGTDDKEGYRRVQEGRLLLKRVRTDIEKRRKELKAGALEYGRKVDAVAKELTGLIEPTEDKLNAISDEHLAALEAIEQQKLNDRMEKLAAIRFQYPDPLVKKMTEREFADLLSEATKTYNDAIEAERVANEEKAKAEADAAEARRLEAEKLKADREALELERKQLADRRAQEQADLRAEQARIAADRKEIERLRQEEADRQQAQRDELDRQQAKIDAENAERYRIEREQQEAEQQAKTEADRLKRIEESKPDRVKLQKAIDVIANLKLPATTTVHGQIMVDWLEMRLEEVFDEFQSKLSELLPTE